MTEISAQVKTHPGEPELAAYLAGTLNGARRDTTETHIASCDACLERLVAARESVEQFRNETLSQEKKDRSMKMKKFNPYLALAVVSFALSFIFHENFWQFLVATVLFGMKWIVDAKSTKMLVMIYDAWKKGGEKEAGRIIGTIEKKRL